MKIFLDTANLESIKKFNDMGLIENISKTLQEIPSCCTIHSNAAANRPRSPATARSATAR